LDEDENQEMPQNIIISMETSPTRNIKSNSKGGTKKKSATTVNRSAQVFGSSSAKQASR